MSSTQMRLDPATAAIAAYDVPYTLPCTRADSRKRPAAMPASMLATSVKW